MIACFDTNIYIGELTGAIPIEQLRQWRQQCILRLCPVVYHELLRGTRSPTLIYEIRDHTIAMASPSFAMWEMAATVLRQYTAKQGFSEALHKLQNDILIALTARQYGALLITTDRHFERLAHYIPFHFHLYQPIA